MNYPELIWCLVEMLLQKENNASQEIGKIVNKQQNTKKQDEVT